MEWSRSLACLLACSVVVVVGCIAKLLSSLPMSNSPATTLPNINLGFIRNNGLDHSICTKRQTKEPIMDLLHYWRVEKKIKNWVLKLGTQKVQLQISLCGIIYIFVGKNKVSVSLLLAFCMMPWILFRSYVPTEGIYNFPTFDWYYGQLWADPS